VVLWEEASNFQKHVTTKPELMSTWSSIVDLVIHLSWAFLKAEAGEGEGDRLLT
jgi:hypothetical protein